VHWFREGMDTVICSLEGRAFQALLNGLSKKNFEMDETITYEYLMEQLYGNIEMEQLVMLAQIKSIEKLLRNAVENYWDQSTFEEILQSTQITSQQHRIFVTFWMNEREKVCHTRIISPPPPHTHPEFFLTICP
jgi:hypothetical protein